MRRLVVIASALLLLTLLGIAWLETRRVNPVALTPALTGQVEYCLSCHAGLPEISKSHPVKTFGCVICHGGERLALDASLAHSSMRGGKNPADYSVVEASCGGANCGLSRVGIVIEHQQRPPSEGRPLLVMLSRHLCVELSLQRLPCDLQDKGPPRPNLRRSLNGSHCAAGPVSQVRSRV